MYTYIIISLLSGILFGILDGLINANPLAQKLFVIYKPIARTSANIVMGIVIDLTYGFILVAMFLLLFYSLPGESGWIKGTSFALLVWFLRVVMNVVSQWMMFEIPFRVLIYILISGLAEMLIIGMLLGLTLQPA